MMENKVFPSVEQRDTRELCVLVLAGGSNELEIVKRCKMLGIKSIVTDYYNEWRRSPAKYESDEAWNVSWNDIDILLQKCRDSHVNGVIAGFSEFPVDSMITLCDQLKMPCYINKKQLELTRDKAKFKKYCKKIGVPIVPEWSVNDNNILFPVIVKPTDRAGSIGISVAYNRDEFEESLFVALEKSPKGTAIVEKFIDNAIKFDSYYEIIDGAPFLIGTSDTVMLSSQRGLETYQKAWSFPSKYENQYKMSVDLSVKEMIKKMNFNFGYCTLSFFYQEGSFYAFETGFRLSGEHSFNYQQMIYGRNYLVDMINYQLGKKIMPYVEQIDNELMIVYNLYIDGRKDDVILTIENDSLISGMKECVSFVSFVYPGMIVQNDAPQKIAMCTIRGENKSIIARCVSRINKLFAVKCKSGIHYLINPLTFSEVDSCWN